MKKNSYVKWVVLVLLTALLMTVAACSNEPDAPAEQGAAAPVTPTQTPTQTPAQTPGQTTPAQPVDNGDIPAIMNPIGTLPIVNEPVTFTVFTGVGAGVDLTTNASTLEFQERTGVVIDWIQVPSADAATRRNLMLATGDLPDIIINSPGTAASIFHYGSLGVFRPITPYIDVYAPELQRLFAAHPDIHADLISTDGQIYAFPSIDDCFHCSIQAKMWVYMPWLDALNIPVPRTIDDFYNMLVAFRDGDPNGNGGEVIPLSFGPGSRMGSFIMNAFITTNDNRLFMDNGVVKPAFDTPQWQEGLRFLNKLYAEGLLAPESFVQDAATLRQVAEHPDYNILGTTQALWVGQFQTLDVSNQEGRWNSWRTIPPITGPEGYVSAPINPLRGFPRAVITSNLPEELMPIAVRWLDNFLTEESALLAIEGIEDLTWRRSDPGQVGIGGGPAVWERIAQHNAPANTLMGNLLPTFRSSEFRLSERADRSIIEQETLLYDETLRYLPYMVDNALPVLFWDEAESVEVTDLATAINTFVAESYARFVVGDLSLDDDWDWYIRELHVIGLDRFLELQQSAYEARLARLAEWGM